MVLEVYFDPSWLRSVPMLESCDALERPYSSEKVPEDSGNGGRLRIHFQTCNFVTREGRVHHLTCHVPIERSEQLLSTVVLRSIQQSFDGGVAGVQGEACRGHEARFGIRHIDAQLPARALVKSDHLEIQGVSWKLRTH